MMSPASCNVVRVAAASAVVCLTAASAPAAPDRHHAVYAELLGKGGLWGLGYDYSLSDRLTLGSVASFYILEDQRVAALSPYLGILIARGGAHAWFAHAGPQFVHVWSPSSVPEWSGESDTGIGGELSTGYEYRSGVLTRVFVQGVVGDGGATPWLGASLGWEF